MPAISWPVWALILIAAIVVGCAHWFAGELTRPRPMSASAQIAIGFFCGVLFLWLTGVLK